MSTRGAGPLNWRAPGGYTPEVVRQAHTMFPFQQEEVVAMLDAADEAHIKRLNEENEVGGEARQVVGEVAVTLGVVLGDTGPRMSVWDPANMRRVVSAAQALRTELAELREAYEKTLSDAARYSEAYSDRIGRHIETYAERDELKATIVSQAREIARLKGESA